MSQITIEYQGREIEVDYYTEENTMYIEGIFYNGRDVTKCVNNEKVYDEMEEVIALKE